MEGDERGFRVALVANQYINPGQGDVDALALLEEEGWGVVQLPPTWYPDGLAAQLLEQVAEQVEEFARHGYELVAVGARAGLAEALAVLGLEPPPAIQPRSAVELARFLRARSSRHSVDRGVR